MDPCLFTRGKLLIVVCVEDATIASKSDKGTENLLHSLKNSTGMGTKKERLELKKFVFTDDDIMKNFLGVSVENTSSVLCLPQHHLISRILEVSRLTIEENSRRSTKDSPETKPLLIKDFNGEPRSFLWNGRSAIGIMNYLSGSTLPDIAMAVYQMAFFALILGESTKRQ